MIGLAELLELIARRWPDKYQRGRILPIHHEVRTSAGLAQLRVMVQLIPERPNQTGNHGGNQNDVDLH